MKRPTLTFGRTLARRMSQDAAHGAICTAIQQGRLRGEVLIAVVATEQPGRLDVEASFRELTIEQALDALQIASRRLAIVHGVRASTAVPVASTDADALQALAERLVDKCRAFGWWERVLGAMKWFGSHADFKHGRDACVRELMHEIAAWRPREVETPVEAREPSKTLEAVA